MRFLLWTNVVMAASAAGWVVVTCLTTAVPVDPVLCLFAFAATAAYYTHDRLVPAEQVADAAAMPARTRWVTRHRTGLRAAVAVEGLVALAALSQRLEVAPMVLMGAVVALAYTRRWLRFRGRRVGVKHLPGAKTPFVATLWTLLTVAAPVVAHAPGHPARWPLAAAVWLLVCVQILVNDLRDVEADRSAGTLSLPVLLGADRARLAGQVAAVVAVVPAVFAGTPGLGPVAVGASMCLHLYAPGADARWRFPVEAQGVFAAVLCWCAALPVM